MLVQSQFYGEKNTNDTCNRRGVHLLTTNQSIESTTNKHSAEMIRQIYLEKDSGCVEIQPKVLESDLELLGHILAVSGFEKVIVVSYDNSRCTCNSYDNWRMCYWN